MLNLAKFWGVDPESVKRWSMVDFADREEYMLIHMDLERPQSAEAGPAAGEREWKGR